MSRFGGTPVKPRFGGTPVQSDAAAQDAAPEQKTPENGGWWDYITRAAGRAGDDATNFTRGLVDTATLGFSDEAGAYIDSYLDPSKTYEQYRDQYRKELADSGNFGTAGQIAGSLIMPGKSIPAMIGQGALYGYNSAEGDIRDRAANAVIGGATSGVVGGLLHGIGKYGTKAFSKAADEAAPAAADAFERGSQLYGKAEAENVRFSKDAVGRLVDDVRKAAGGADADGLYPQSMAVLKKADGKVGSDLSLQKFDEFRQIVGDELADAKGTDRRTLKGMKKAVDAFADNATADDVTGDIATALPLLKDARSQWATGSKLRTLERFSALDEGDSRATSAVLKGEASKLYKKIVAGKADSNWTSDEIALIKDMSLGKAGAFNKLMQVFDPKKATGLLASGVVSHLSSIPYIGTGLSLMGAAASHNADTSAERILSSLQRTVANGGKNPAAQSAAKKGIIGGLQGLPLSAAATSNQTLHDYLTRGTALDPNSAVSPRR